MLPVLNFCCKLTDNISGSKIVPGESGSGVTAAADATKYTTPLSIYMCVCVSCAFIYLF